MEIIALTLDIIGKVMIAYTAIAVHHRFRKEHKVDEAVFRIMRWESILGMIGILLMIASYIIRIVIYING